MSNYNNDLVDVFFSITAIRKVVLSHQRRCKVQILLRDREPKLDISEPWDTKNEALRRIHSKHLELPIKKASIEFTAAVEVLSDNKGMDKCCGGLSCKRAGENFELAQLIIAVATEVGECIVARVSS